MRRLSLLASVFVVLPWSQAGSNPFAVEQVNQIGAGRQEVRESVGRLGTRPGAEVRGSGQIRMHQEGRGNRMGVEVEATGQTPSDVDVRQIGQGNALDVVFLGGEQRPAEFEIRQQGQNNRASVAQSVPHRASGIRHRQGSLDRGG